jgi:hypothetical protein
VIATILSIVAVLVVLLVVSLFGVAVWARRGERKPDVGGVRTLAAFKGGDQFISVEERQDEQTEGSAALGGGLLAALVREIEKQGLEVEAPDRDDYGWGVTVRGGEDKAYVHLGAIEEASAWALMVLDPGSGGPGPRALLPAIDAALKALPGLSKIAWHRRERFLAGDLSSAYESATA